MSDYARSNRETVLELRNVLGGWAFLALNDVELDALALGQRLVAVALDRRMMNEAILLAILRRDESKTLRVVEPLYCAGRTHCRTPYCVWRVGVRNAVLADLPVSRPTAARTKKAPSKCQGLGSFLR